MGAETDPEHAYAGIELGGTKVLCRVVDAQRRVLADGRFVTSTARQAIDDVSASIRIGLGRRPLAALGVASFGPLVVDPRAPGYGRLLATPKVGWSDFDLCASLVERFAVPLAIETDVGAAALAEQVLGAGRGLACVAYVTVGTGIGGGLVVDQAVFKGALHPEIGHMRLRRRSGDGHASTCPFHEDCAEGLASGPAIAQRLRPGRALAEAPEVAALIGAYLGDLAANLLLAWSPQRIVLGGGVMSTPGLLGRVDAAMRAALGDYGAAVIADASYLVAPQLADAGLEGALILARRMAPAPLDARAISR